MLPQAFIDVLAQFAKVIGPKQCATGADRHYKVRLENIGPLDRQRPQPTLGASIRHAVSAPVVAHREQIERLSSQRMEWMGDGKSLCAVLITICDTRQTPKPR